MLSDSPKDHGSFVALIPIRASFVLQKSQTSMLSLEGCNKLWRLSILSVTQTAFLTIKSMELEKHRIKITDSH